MLSSRSILLLGLIAAASPAAAESAEPAAAGAEVRTLVVILDAVPFGAVEDLFESRSASEPLFEGFQPPRPLISSFPSSTSVAMVGLLEPFDLARSPGYEARFFDWSRRRVRGGGAISFFRIEFAWREFFDWSRKGVVRSAFGGLRPVAASVTRVEDAVEAFMQTDLTPYFVYLETTDLAAHLKGPDELGVVLERLDAALVQAREDHPETPFRTVVLSDHGVDGDGGRLVNALPAARDAARAAGFRLQGRLRRPGDAVLTPFGLVSSFEAYAGDEDVEALRTALAGAPGVDLCLSRSPGGARVESELGSARFERRPDSADAAWRYVVESADPLDYREIATTLAGPGAGSDYIADSRWLEATAGHTYPDAFHRIVRAFDLVENPASVLCSLEPGYMYGRSSTEWLARVSGATVRWTHGALSRGATLGFLLTDDERFGSAGPVRFDRALAPLVAPRDDGPATAGAPAAERVGQDKILEDQ